MRLLKAATKYIAVSGLAFNVDGVGPPVAHLFFVVSVGDNDGRTVVAVPCDPVRMKDRPHDRSRIGTIAFESSPDHLGSPFAFASLMQFAHSAPSGALTACVWAPSIRIKPSIWRACLTQEWTGPVGVCTVNSAGYLSIALSLCGSGGVILMPPDSRNWHLGQPTPTHREPLRKSRFHQLTL